MLHLFGRGDAREKQDILPDYGAHGIERFKYSYGVEYPQRLKRLVAGQIGEDGLW